MPSLRRSAAGLALLAALALAGVAGGAAAKPGKLAVGSWRDGSEAIYTVRGDGTGPVKRLTTGFPSGGQPSWSGAARRIAFSVYAPTNGETHEIWTSTPTGAGLRRLTGGFGDENPSWSRDGKRIAFTRNQFQLWTMRADGTGQKKLLYGADDPASWRPDGKRIAYGNNGRLFTIAASGGKPQRIGSPVRERRFTPVYSPDGRRIAFTASKGGRDPRLYLMRADGTGVIELTHGGHIEVLAQPAWSPDGKQLVYSLYLPAHTEALYLVRADGTAKPRRLSHPAKGYLDLRATWSPNGATILFARNEQLWTIPSRGGRERLLRPVFFYNAPSWSPDGTRLAVARAGVGKHGFIGTSTSDIYLLPATGGTPQKLTADPHDDYDPAWSPDGKTIAFASDRVQAPKESFGAIYLVGTNGKGLKMLVDHASSPSWSPDGKQLAYTDGADEPAPRIAVIRRDGTGARDLTESDIFESPGDPSWSPDGKQIAFVTDKGIFVMKADGTGRRKLTKSRSYAPVWSPDGTRIAFVRADGIHVVVVASGADTKILDDPRAGALDWHQE